MPFFLSMPDSSSDFSMEMVPTSTGCPLAWHSSICWMMARYFPPRSYRPRRGDPLGPGACWWGSPPRPGCKCRELLFLGHGGTGHAGELVVKAEVILEGDGGQRLDSGPRSRAPWPRWPDAGPRVAPAKHQPPGELVHDDDLAVLHHIVDVPLHEAPGPDGLVDMMGEGWCSPGRPGSPDERPARPCGCPVAVRVTVRAFSSTI